MTLPPRLASVRSSLVLVPAALAILLLAGWRRANPETGSARAHAHHIFGSAYPAR